VGLLQLTFSPFMAIEADFDAPGGVGAELDGGFAEVGVVAVEVVVFDEDGLAGVVEAQLAGAGGAVFGGLEAVGFFLSGADEDHRIADRTLAAHLVSHRVFALAFLGGHNRNLMLLNVRLDLGNIVLADLAQKGRGGDGEFKWSTRKRTSLEPVWRPER